MIAPAAKAVASVSSGPLGAVAAGHPLAVDAALAVLQGGGNAIDAAVAAHAVLAVVMPNACGVGGDSLFLVHTPSGVTAVNGSGRSARAAPEGEARHDGGGSVTVPGSVHAWSELVSRHGRQRLSDALGPAIRVAEDGFDVDTSLVTAVHEQRDRLVRGGAGDWALVHASANERLRQPELAAMLGAVATDGTQAFYGGRIADALCRAVHRDGGRLDLTDLESHETVVGEPVSVGWDGGRVHVQPPSSQGVLLAMALQWLDERGGTVDAAAREHVQVELTEAVFGFRDRCLSDGAALLDQPLAIDPLHASRRGGPRAYLHTTGVAVADAEGTVVSSLLSVFDDFGSGTFVAEGGFTLNNRAGGFTTGANAPGPGRRPVHTLAPILVERGSGVLALATPGADGQVQTLLQLLCRLRYDAVSLPAAVSAPRWRSEGGDLLVAAGHPAAADLGGRGHRVVTVDDGDPRLGAVVSAANNTWSGTQPSATGDWRRHVATGGA